MASQSVKHNESSEGAAHGRATPSAAMLAASASDLYEACADAEAVYAECMAIDTEAFTACDRLLILGAMMAAIKGCAAAAREARGEAVRR